MDNLIEINSSIHDDICPGSECCYYRVCRQNHGYCPKKIIRTAIQKCDEREQYIINLHCGFYDGKQYSFAEIGRRLEITGTRVSQIYKDALLMECFTTIHHGFYAPNIPEQIVSYCNNSAEHTKFLRDVYYKPESERSINYKERTYETYKICGYHIPREILKYALEYESLEAIIDKLKLSVDDWKISQRLRIQLKNNDIDNLAGIVSLPFFMLFFHVLEFSYNLLIELQIALQKQIPAYKHGGSPVNVNNFCIMDFNDKGKKQSIKEYIYRYIENHGKFLHDYSVDNKMDRLYLKAERLRTASLISELWYTDSFHLLDLYGFNFQKYWQRVNQEGFDINGESELVQTIQNHYFPETIKTIAEQSTKQCICNLDIDYCRNSLMYPIRKSLRQANINTIGELLEYPESEYTNLPNLKQHHPIAITYLQKMVHDIQNFFLEEK